MASKNSNRRKKATCPKIYPTALAQPAPSKEENAAERGITCLHAGGLEKKVNNALLFFYIFFSQQNSFVCFYLCIQTDKGTCTMYSCRERLQNMLVTIKVSPAQPNPDSLRILDAARGTTMLISCDAKYAGTELKKCLSPYIEPPLST